ncbi:mitochondrial acyl carrier protein [Malassezia equina]|uniref:Acyl carrier protein n=1 Tax=Malassezia equina TaxID=1381935 RepID=A0AAF0IZX3_9BASI|nr:mitochondrial acyl carrier protein [Malassezia equina]
MFPRALRASPMLARAAPVMRVPLARMPVAVPMMARGYASAGGPSLEEIKARINEVLKSFEKVDAAKLSPTASFMNDLGLDSLDSVEVVMAIEEEFNIVRMAP